MRQETALLIQSKMPGLDLSWKFGHASFQTREKVFCFINREGSLTLKLPAERIEELVSADIGRKLTMGKRIMREWVVVPVESDPSRETLKLLRDAREYVESLAAPARKGSTTKKAAKAR